MSDDMLAELEADAQAEEQTTDLSEISALAEKQLRLEGEVDAIEQQLKDKKEELRKVEQDQLPAAMKAARLSSFTLESGQVVSVKEDLSISVPKKRKADIIRKVREDFGHPELISSVISVEVEKGKDNVAGEAMHQLAELGLEPSRAEDIKTPSLKKLLLDRRKEGKNDDLSYFGGFLVTKATVK